jgi:hypothetical protein
MLALVRAGAPSYARPSPSLPGVLTGEVVRLSSVVWLRRVEGVRADPIFSTWPALLGSCLALIVWAFADCCVAGRAA